MRTQPTPEEQLAYKAACRARGFKSGDMVKIIRKCDSYSNGWNGEWMGEMDSMVGSTHRISNLGDSTGSPRLNGCFFPHFAVVKVDGNGYPIEAVSTYAAPKPPAPAEKPYDMPAMNNVPGVPQEEPPPPPPRVY